MEFLRNLFRPKKIELNYRYIANKLPLKFTEGNSNILKNIMFKDNMNFLTFTCKNQFYNLAKSLYPGIDREKLHEDFYKNIHIIISAYRFCFEYNRSLQGKSKRIMLFRFRFNESWKENDISIKLGEEFKIINDITLPIDHEFWNTYYPPNFPGDNSTISSQVYEDISVIPKNLPVVDIEFVIDYKKLFFANGIRYKENKDVSSFSNSENRMSMEIDVNDLVITAIFNVCDEKEIQYNDSDKENIINLINNKSKK